MYGKEKTVKSKIVKSLTAEEEDDDDDGTSCATRRSRLQKHRRQPYWKVGEEDEEADAEEVGNGGKMELPEGPNGKP